MGCCLKVLSVLAALFYFYLFLLLLKNRLAAFVVYIAAVRWHSMCLYLCTYLFHVRVCMCVCLHVDVGFSLLFVFHIPLALDGCCFSMLYATTHTHTHFRASLYIYRSGTIVVYLTCACGVLLSLTLWISAALAKVEQFGTTIQVDTNTCRNYYNQAHLSKCTFNHILYDLCSAFAT